jgi:hypothetical protein
VSGSGAGDVKFWDIRMSSSNNINSTGKGTNVADVSGMPTAAACVNTIQTEATDMSALAVHGYVYLHVSTLDCAHLSGILAWHLTLDGFSLCTLHQASQHLCSRLLPAAIAGLSAPS